MAKATTAVPSAYPQERTALEIFRPRRWMPNISLFSLLVYLIMTFGAIIFAMPFFWMISTSLMNQSETARGIMLPESELIGLHPVSQTDLNRPMADYLNARKEFTFSGTRAEIIYDAVPNGGVVDIYVDDLYLTSLDTSSEQAKRHQVLVIDSYPALPTFGQTQTIPLADRRHTLRLEFNSEKSMGSEFWLYGMRVPAPQTETLHFGLFISEGTLTQSVSEVIELAPRERSPYGNWETVAFDATSQTWEAASWNQTLSRWENADQEPIPAASVTWQATHVGFPEYYDAAVRKTISLSGDERSETQHEYISRRKFGGYAIMELPLVGDYVVTGGFSNYIKVWNDADFADAFINSVLITGLTILGQTIFSILAAYAFARIEFPGKNILFMLFLMTIFIPFMVILIPNVITVTNISNWSFENIGPIFDDLGKNIFLFKWVGLDATDARWMGNWPGLVVIFWTSTFSIFLLRQFFVQIPTELWDAAQIDGAGHLRFLFQIVVPISRAAIMTTVLFTFISTWNLLEWPIIVTQKSTEWKPIAVALYEFQSDEGALPNLVMSGAMISLLPVIIIYLITQKQFTEGIATTGLKG